MDLNYNSMHTVVESVCLLANAQFLMLELCYRQEI